MSRWPGRRCVCRALNRHARSAHHQAWQGLSLGRAEEEARFCFFDVLDLATRAVPRDLAYGDAVIDCSALLGEQSGAASSSVVSADRPEDTSAHATSDAGGDVALRTVVGELAARVRGRALLILDDVTLLALQCGGRTAALFVHSLRVLVSRCAVRMR